MGASCGPGFRDEVGVLRLIVAVMALACLTAPAEAAGATAPSTPGSAPAGASGSSGESGASAASGPSGTPAAGGALQGPFRSLPIFQKGSAPPGLASPRAAVTSYLIAARAARYGDAANYLDLSDIPEEKRAERGPLLAREMKIVLDQRLWIDLETLTDRPEGILDDGLDPRRERVGVIETDQGVYDVTLRKREGPNGDPEWRFSPGTLDRIETLYATIGYGSLLGLLPDWTTRMRFGQLMLWQWLALMLLAVIATLLSGLVTRLVLDLIVTMSRRTDPDFRSRLFESARPPMRLAAVLAIVVTGALWLRLSVPARRVLGHVLLGMLLVLLTWTVLRLIDFATSRTLEKLAAQGRRSGVTTLVLIRRIAKALVVIIAIVAGLQNLGFNVSGLLAGVGIVGAAVALAAQKTLENLFGGLVLTADEPIRIGDQCKVNDRLGTVEDIGLRSTRIRTLDRSILSVPNAEMSTVSIENTSLRDRHRLETVLSLRYETTAEQLNATLAGIRRLLEEDERVSPLELRVRFIAFGDYALKIEVVAYLLTTDLAVFYEYREDLLLKMMKIVADSGPGFAFPTQTLYMSDPAAAAIAAPSDRSGNPSKS